MGIVYRGIPQQKVLDRYGENYNILVETGTHVGNTALWAVDWFKEVHTIESVFEYYQKAKNKLIYKNNVFSYYGYSQVVLPHIISTLEHNRTPAIFWLDAHWSPDLEGNKPDVICPVLQEISFIRKSNLDHVILVDDARLFDNTKGWPSLEKVLDLLGSSAYVEDDVIWSR